MTNEAAAISPELIEAAMDAYDLERSCWTVCPDESSAFTKDGRTEHATYVAIRHEGVGLARFYPPEAEIPEASVFERRRISAIHKDSMVHEAAMEKAILAALNTTRSPVLSDEQAEVASDLVAYLRWYSRDVAPEGKVPHPKFIEAADLIEALSRSGMEG